MAFFGKPFFLYYFNKNEVLLVFVINILYLSTSTGHDFYHKNSILIVLTLLLGIEYV
jgi:hypothetical protein